MSRHAFWTIIVGGSPTAFRAPLPEDLQPTLVQLQRAHPDAVIRWFEKGQLWETPGHAQDAASAKRDEARPRRGPTWRPGGDHKDPRDKYKLPRDVKRKKWASQAAEGRGPWVKKEGRDEGTKGPRNQGTKEPRSQGREDARTRAADTRRTPDSGDRRPPPRDARAPRPEWRKAAGDRPPQDRKPAGADRRPPGADRRAASPDRRPPSADRRPASGDRRPPTGDRRPSPDRRPAGASGDRRPIGGDRRPAGGDRRPASATGGRPPSTGRPPRPPGTPSAPPSAASAKRKPRVFKAGEMPPKRKKREDE